LSEQHIAQPQGQNGAETVADELKGLEQRHFAWRSWGSRPRLYAVVRSADR
jgi:hypothetical protein